MFSTKLLAFALSLIETSYLFAQAQTDSSCNPLTATCPANPGLDTGSYFVDFTQNRALPANWTLANFENVTYGANGVEFAFAKRLDAPYIWTDFYILFGHVEVVMQAAPGGGIISSAVLMSDDLDEIDWEFSGNNFNTASGKVQTNYFGKGVIGNYDRGTYPVVDSPQTQFHTYALDWSPTILTWSIDGMVVRTLSNNNATSGPYQYPQSPMKLQLGVWDGGDANNAGGTVEWAGGYTDLSKAPFTMYVKSVKITTATPCSGGYQYTDMSGSYQSVKCVNTKILSSSNSTVPPRPNGSDQGNSAPTSPSLPALSSALFSANTSTMALTSDSVPQSSAVVVPVETSSSLVATAMSPSMSSILMSKLSTPIIKSTLGQVSAISPFTSTVITSIFTSSVGTSATEADASSPTQSPSPLLLSKTQVCTAPTLVPPFPLSSTSFANSTSSVPPTSTISTTSSTTSSTTIPPTKSTSILPAIFTGAATRLLPRLGWMNFFLKR